MNKIYGIIYKTTNLINGKIYIGQVMQKYNKPNYLGSGKLIKYAVKKYGVNNFIKEEIDIAYNKNDIDNKEKYYILKFNSTNPLIGYNISTGGSFGDTFTNNPNKENIRHRLKESCKRKHEGKKNSFYGKKHSEETKKIISIKNKISMTNFMSKLSKEEKSNKFGSHGENNPNWGKKHTPESIQKMKESHKNVIMSEDTKQHKKKLLREYKYIKVNEIIQNEIINMYCEKKMIMKDIANRVNLSYTKVREIIHNHKITPYDQMERELQKLNLETENKIIILYKEPNITLKDIHLMLNVSHPIIKNILTKNNIPLKRIHKIKSTIKG